MEKIYIIALIKKIVTYFLSTTTALTLLSNDMDKAKTMDDLNKSCNYLIDIVEEQIISLYQMIDHYCEIYNFKTEEILKILSDKLELNLKENNIDDSYINGEELEVEIITIIDDIYENPEDYSIKLEDITREVCTYYETDYYPEELISKYTEMFGVNETFALTISYTECGFEYNPGVTENYAIRNNPAGIGPYNCYPTREAGVIRFILLLKNGYGCTNESDAEKLKQMANVYSGGTPEHWLGLALPYYYDLTENGLDYYVNLREKKSKVLNYSK